MQYLHTNNAATTLRDAITPGSTQITVPSGHGTLFPLPGVDQGFFVTVEDRRSGRLEIMLCTVRTGDSLTVTGGRGQQGTIPQSFPAGVSVANRITAQILNEFVAATVNELPLERLPMVPDAKIINMSSSKLLGEVPPGLLPTIPSTKLTSVPAESLTGTIHADRLPDPLPAAKLPVIPAAKLTSVPAESLTGTINPARIAALSITDAKIADLAATKLTGTINNARLPQAISITNDLAVRNVVATGHLVAGTYITAEGNITSDSIVNGTLHHKLHGGYMRLGAYDAARGTGSARLWYDSVADIVTVQGEVGGTTLAAANFSGSGAGLTGVPFSSVTIPGLAAIGSYAMLRHTDGGTVAPGATKTGSVLDYATADGGGSGSSPSAASVWMCCGYGGSSSDGHQTTLWRRQS